MAAEQLAERQGMAVNAETLRGWLLANGVPHFQRRKRRHRAGRERRAPVGERIQREGSHHDWLEGRGPRGVRMASIDDASSRVSARFYPYEGTIPARDRCQRYVTRDGIPLAVYADTPTTYRSPAEPTVEAQLAGTKPQSQFGRALTELGVDLIAAHSPQAKGRVERLFTTVHDRRIKERRLAGSATLEDANRFLEGDRPRDNQRVAVTPAQTADLHRPTRPIRELERSVCLKTTRCLRKDFTIGPEKRLYQGHATLRATHVVVEAHVEGTMRLTHQGRSLGFHAIPERPVPAAEAPAVSRSRRPITQKSAT
ncbi:MAG: hypothetical protein AAB308_12575 [Nitrospirota bacterium]